MEYLLMASSVTVNPTFRLDVDGKLFKNKESNLNVQDTITFNNLMSRLSIEKGYLPLFPNLGLKQHLHNFSFVEKVIFKPPELIIKKNSSKCKNRFKNSLKHKDFHLYLLLIK